jgi:hypothetical protein
MWFAQLVLRPGMLALEVVVVGGLTVAVSFEM